VSRKIGDSAMPSGTTTPEDASFGYAAGSEIEPEMAEVRVGVCWDAEGDSRFGGGPDYKGGKVLRRDSTQTHLHARDEPAMVPVGDRSISRMGDSTSAAAGAGALPPPARDAGGAARPPLASPMATRVPVCVCG
jgi:hypothetical protein